MHLRESLASLITAIAIFGCSQASNHTDLGEHRLSSCVIEKGARPPNLGVEWTECKDQINYTALITMDPAPTDGPSIVLDIREQDRAALEAFLSRNIHSITALRKGNTVLSLVAISGSSANSFDLYLEPAETAGFKAALK